MTFIDKSACRQFIYFGSRVADPRPGRTEDGRSKWLEETEDQRVLPLLPKMVQAALANERDQDAWLGTAVQVTPQC